MSLAIDLHLEPSLSSQQQLQATPAKPIEEIRRNLTASPSSSRNSGTDVAFELHSSSPTRYRRRRLYILRRAAEPNADEEIQHRRSSQLRAQEPHYHLRYRDLPRHTVADYHRRRPRFIAPV